MKSPNGFSGFTRMETAEPVRIGQRSAPPAEAGGVNEGDANGLDELKAA